MKSDKTLDIDLGWALKSLLTTADYSNCRLQVYSKDGWNDEGPYDLLKPDAIKNIESGHRYVLPLSEGGSMTFYPQGVTVHLPKYGEVCINYDFLEQNFGLNLGEPEPYLTQHPPETAKA